MKNRRNYYRLLQVQPDAAIDVIKASYRTMMQKLRFHPDLGGDEEHAALINEAYAVLSDPERRARYDAQRERALGAMGVHGRMGRPHPGRARVPARPAQTPGSETLTCPVCGTLNHAPIAIPDTRRCHSCRSPLQPAARAPGAASGQRAVPRLDRETLLRYRSVEAGTRAGDGMLVDVSSQGLRFRGSQPVPVGQVLRIECDLLSAVARVMRCRPQGPGTYVVGTAFVTVEFRRTVGGLLSAQA